jgi:hypothetical protein
MRIREIEKQKEYLRKLRKRSISSNIFRLTKPAILTQNNSPARLSSIEKGGPSE